MPKIKLNLTALQATGTDTPILVGVSDDVEWVDGPDGKRHPGARIGTRYTVLMLQNACMPLAVHTPEEQPVKTQEELDAANVAGQFVRVRFEGFIGDPYQGKNGLGISATAEKVVVVSAPIVKKEG